MKRILFAFIALYAVHCDLAYSQNNTANQEKYWYYRYRLRTEFLKEGDFCGDPSGVHPTGYSVPAGVRYTSAYNLPYSISWGDGSSHLGIYIGVLATEYKLLINYEQPTDKVLEELFYAMKAYERLDALAESTFEPKSNQSVSCTETLNGFFVRDDVNHEFMSKYFNVSSQFGASDFTRNHNDNNAASDGLRFPSVDQIAYLISGFAFVVKNLDNITYNYGTGSYNFKQMAKTYTQKIMDRLSSDGWEVKHPVSNVVVKYGGETFARKGLAKAAQVVITEDWGGNFVGPGSYDNSISQLHSNLWESLNYPSGYIFYQTNVDPITVTNSASGTTINFGSAGSIQVPISGPITLGVGSTSHTIGQDYNNAIIGHLASVGNSWHYGLVPSYHSINISFQYPCPGNVIYCCRNVCLFGKCKNICIACGVQVWTCWFNESLGYTCYKNTLTSNAFGALNLFYTQINQLLGGAFGPLPSVVITALQAISNVLPSLCLPGTLDNLSVNSTGYALSEIGKEFDVELFSLAHKHLHNRGPYTINSAAVLGILNSAPCEGPHYFPQGDPLIAATSGGVAGWQVGNRWAKSTGPRPEEYPSGSYNGLDYMLFHNLYYLTHTDLPPYPSLPLYKDKQRLSYSNLSLPSGSVGTISNPIRYQAFENLFLTNSTFNGGSSPASVTLKAGKNVRIGAGSAFKAGSFVRAHVGPFTCSSSTGYQRGIIDSTWLSADADLHHESVNEEVVASKSPTSYKLPNDYILEKKASKFMSSKSSFLTSDFDLKNEVKIYPNPARNTALLSLYSDNSSRCSISIYDALGKKIDNHSFDDYELSPGKNEIDLNISMILPGSYSVVVEGQTIYSRQLLIKFE